MKKVILGAIAAIAFGSNQPVLAADLAPIYKAPPPPPSVWFFEARAGAAFGRFDDLKFLNPVGAATGAVRPDGNFIILDGKNLRDTSFTGGASIGYYFAHSIFAKVSYQYLGRFRANGFADFGVDGNFRQDLTTDVHALLLGIGIDIHLTPAIFLQPTAEIGAGFLHSTGRQGANLGLPNAFPSADRTNMVGGAGLGLGYHVTRNFDVLISGNYYWLGNADTGTTGNPPPAGMNPGEQLKAHLNVTTLTVGGRVRF